MTYLVTRIILTVFLLVFLIPLDILIIKTLKEQESFPTIKNWKNINILDENIIVSLVLLLVGPVAHIGLPLLIWLIPIVG